MDGDKLLARLSLAVLCLAPIAYCNAHKKEYVEYKFKAAHHSQCKERTFSLQPGEMRELPNGEILSYASGVVFISASRRVPAVQEIRKGKFYETHYNDVMYEIHDENGKLALHEIDCR